MTFMFFAMLEAELTCTRARVRWLGATSTSGVRGSQQETLLVTMRRQTATGDKLQVWSDDHSSMCAVMHACSRGDAHRYPLDRS